jgi:protoheme IX farnesyltransferase
MFKIFSDLSKFGITIFVILSGVCGYALSFEMENGFNGQHLLIFVLGQFLLSSGSLALNQVQEVEKDRKMPRTEKRPIVRGKISKSAALLLSVFMLAVGFILLWKTSVTCALVGLAIVVLYNGLYTYWWKPRWVFAAIPGAVPGALPATMGYAANDPRIFEIDSIYLFAVMFLWQMPHFWALAIKYKDDYSAGGVPTMPVAIGVERTLIHMAIYTFLYVLLAILSPMFVPTSWGFLLLVLPVSYMVLHEFLRFYRSKGQERWLAFFLWINVSVLIYQIVPVIDKWLFLIVDS